MANWFFRSKEKSAQDFKKNHCGYNWLLVAPVGRLPEVGVIGTKNYHTETVFPVFQKLLFASQELVLFFFKISGDFLKFVKPLKSCDFDFLELGVLLLSFPLPLVLCSLPP